MDDLIERLRAFVVERGKVACGSDIVSACNNSALSLSDLRALLGALEAAREDAKRLDWMEQADFSSVGDGGKTGVGLTVYPLDGDGEWYGGRTLREAIDTARKEPTND